MKQGFRILAWAVAMNAGLVSAATAGQSDTHTTGDMVQTRSQVRQKAPEDRRDLQTEMRNRMQSMSAEESSLYRQMNSQRTRYGSGSRESGRYGKGGGSGSGNQYRHQHRHQYRNDQGTRQGHASGYGGSGRGRGQSR